MKTKQNIFQLAGVIAILILGSGFVQASEVPDIQWNETAQGQVMNNNELVKLGDAFPTWEIKQITWPSASEINTKRVTVDPNLTAQCMGWLSKFIKREQLPIDLDKKLVAMKEWGVIGKESEQKCLCDVFITRFKKDSMVVQIQESPSNVVIAFSNEQLMDTPAENHKNLVVEAANLLLNSNLKPPVSSENLHVFEIVKDGQTVTRVSWGIESVKVIDKDGKKCIDLHKAGEIGTTSVEAETDGRFVKFDIRKEVESKGIDPFKERFGSSK